MSLVFGEIDAVNNLLDSNLRSLEEKTVGPFLVLVAPLVTCDETVATVDEKLHPQYSFCLM